MNRNSNKREKQRQAESDIPQDEFTWTEGINYGMDGYHYEQTMGLGLEHADAKADEGPFIPSQTYSMSTLPQDMFTTGEMGERFEQATFLDEGALPDLEGFFSEEEGALGISPEEERDVSLVDLTWLDPSQEQDIERLPKSLRLQSPKSDTVKELEDAWSAVTTRPNNYRIPGQDLEEMAEMVITRRPEIDEQHDKEVEKHIVQKALRMAHARKPLAEIRSFLEDRVGRRLATAAYDKIQAEYGLLGNVYVLASAYPGMSKGKWAAEIRRHCKTARYIVTNNPQDAVKTGKKRVEVVPWEGALRRYASVMTPLGYSFKERGGSKQTLRMAFIQGPKNTVRVDTGAKPVDIRPADRVTITEALGEFRTWDNTPETVKARDPKEGEWERLRKYAERVVALGYLGAEEVSEMCYSSQNPSQIMRKMTLSVRESQKGRVGDYQGQGEGKGGVDPNITMREAAKDLREMWEPQSEIVTPNLREVLVAYIEKGVEQGRSSEDIARVFRKALDAKKYRQACVILSEVLPDIDGYEAPSKQAPEYENDFTLGDEMSFEFDEEVPEESQIEVSLDGSGILI